MNTHRFVNSLINFSVKEDTRYRMQKTKRSNRHTLFHYCMVHYFFSHSTLFSASSFQISPTTQEQTSQSSLHQPSSEGLTSTPSSHDYFESHSVTHPSDSCSTIPPHFVVSHIISLSLLGYLLCSRLVLAGEVVSRG